MLFLCLIWTYLGLPNALFAEIHRKSSTLEQVELFPSLCLTCMLQTSKVYGDNVFEKHGINRDRTGDGEKPRCLCGKRGIFNRDGAANYQTT